MNGYGVATEAGGVRFERVLPGPIERVWAYLTEPEKRAQWLAGGEMELREGGRVELIFNNNSLCAQRESVPEKYRHCADECRQVSRVTRCEPPRLLGFTWDEGSPDGASEVLIELSARGGNVLLVLTHRRLGTRRGMLSVSGGWHTHLDILVDRLHGRDPELFWAKITRLEAEYETRLSGVDVAGPPAEQR